MKFFLFSEISFEVSHPIALIESYCFQSDFYANYDLLNYRNRSIKNVSKIGARIERKKTLRECKDITEKTQGLAIFKYEHDLDRFLRLDAETRNHHIIEFYDKVINKLLKVDGIKLPKATKVLHTLYPEIIPMIDTALKDEYKKEINGKWTEKSAQIFVDYYNNFKKGDNLRNLTDILKQLCSNNVVGLTKVRIFDILWWSYLKSKKLRQKETINWLTIK